MIVAPGRPAPPSQDVPRRRAAPRSPGARARRAVAPLALVALLVVAACGDPAHATAGIVIAVESGGGRVTGFTLRTPEGETLPFVIGDLEVDGAAFAASHLTEHAVTLQPIAVAYRVVDGDNVVHRMVDAPWAGPSP